ncbi:hypothetical protein [Campylobacter sp. JMF_08 NE1]|uniref:hypothetical protein n=1 Tax=Campylobacter sp. JMF_08 NE1 TaxID=2983821 RepID=UPI0022E9D9F6|nr:hypothetical protein [Campylobacter sp. JMF_08 NE1]MDA3048134.1 hypothetical protein [Campylobacter sp. JMF_08 NE1]
MKKVIRYSEGFIIALILSIHSYEGNISANEAWLHTFLFATLLWWLGYKFTEGFGAGELSDESLEIYKEFAIIAFGISVAFICFILSFFIHLEASIVVFCAIALFSFFYHPLMFLLKRIFRF